MRALVVFHDLGSHPFARFLRKGFKHCLVAIQTKDHWVEIDPLFGVPLIRIKAARGFDMMGFYRELGFTVIQARQTKKTELKFCPISDNFFVNNCVGMVKAILGIQKPLIFTPWQLYHFLSSK